MAGKMARVREICLRLDRCAVFSASCIDFIGIYSIQEPFPQLLIVCILLQGGGMIGGMIS